MRYLAKPTIVKLGNITTGHSDAALPGLEAAAYF